MKVNGLPLDGGWIYVLMNSLDYNSFKVGRTIQNPMVRYTALRTGNVGLAFYAAYFVPSRVSRLSHAERYFHSFFGDVRTKFHDEEALSEWFQMKPAAACQELESLFEDWSGSPVATMYRFGEPCVCRAFEQELNELYVGNWWPNPNLLPSQLLTKV